MNNNNTWTIKALKQYFNDILNERDKRINLHFDQMDRAVTKAEVATEKRFEGVNEFRAALQDLTRTFVPRQEIENIVRSINDKLETYCAKLDKIENMKQGGNVVWAYVLSGVSLIAAIIAIITRIGG